MTPKEKLEQIHTNDREIKGQVNALRQYGMGITGIQRDRLGDVVYDLADGYGQGGGGGIDKVQIAELNVTWGNSTVSDIGRATPPSLDFDTIVCEHYGAGKYLGCQVKSIIPNSDKSYNMGFVDATGFVTGSYGKLTATIPTTDNPEITFGWERIGGGHYHPSQIKIYTAKMLHIFAK